MHAWGPICLLLILQFVTSGCQKEGQLPHKCKLSPKEGKCKKALERVYYDHKKKICLNFVYGGCGGNKNNFATLQDCLYQCKKFDLELPAENTAGNIDWKKLISRRCRLYPKKGWCKKHSTRYYYDFKLHRCRAFTYHGCGGNENNFSNYIDCVKACDVFVFMPQKCKLPPKKGKCNEDFENFYYDYKSNTCKSFVYGGCGGNKNNFVNLLDCYYTCKRFGFFSTWENIVGDIQWRKKTPWKCKLWARKGRCKGKIPRYYYDAHNKRCRSFTYSGCGGNANNFQTFNECNKDCDAFGSTAKPHAPESMLETCDQPMDVGPCSENFPRFYYDRTTKTCKPFRFGGCNGNRNNFLNQEDCLQECKPV